MAELAQYNGKTRSRIFIALNGTVFDVTRSAQIYSAETGSYRQLVGRDSSRVFVTGCLGKPDEYTHDLRELDPALVDKNLALWLDYYRNHKNYWEVGTVQLETPDPDTTLPPAANTRVVQDTRMKQPLMKQSIEWNGSSSIGPP